MDILLMLVVFGGIMYFLMIRPQQKRMREHQQMVDALTPGSRVLLTSGIFATVLHVGERQMIVELAPGTEVTVVKGHISKVVTPDDEEFEYEDAPATAEGVEETEHVATDEELREMFDAPAEGDVNDPYVEDGQPLTGPETKRESREDR